MDLTRLLPKNRVILLPKVEVPRRELLAMMAEPLVADGVVTDLEGFLDSLELRESDMSTQMRGGVALPHACSPAVRKLGLVVAKVSGDGCVFDPDSTELCQIFFLMSVPAAAPAAHLPLFSHLAGFITAAGKLDELRKAETVEEMHQLLVQWKRA